MILRQKAWVFAMFGLALVVGPALVGRRHRIFVPYGINDFLLLVVDAPAVIGLDAGQSGSYVVGLSGDHVRREGAYMQGVHLEGRQHGAGIKLITRICGQEGQQEREQLNHVDVDDA